MSETCFISPSPLLKHWQAHRELTRRVIEAFPEDKLFTFSVGGMRPFGEMAMEPLTMAVPTVQGVLSGNWHMAGREKITKSELLRRWDENTAEIDVLWPQIPAARFSEKMTTFGQWPGVAHDIILRDRQRNSPSRAGVCVFARTRNRAARLL